MIKSVIIILIFACGHLCRVVPDEVPVEDNTEERTVNEQTVPSDEERKADSSQNTEILLKADISENTEILLKADSSDNTEILSKADSSDNTEILSKADGSDNTEILSKEAAPEEKRTANSDQTEEKGKNADLEEKFLKIRSTEESKAAESENNETSATETRIDDTVKTAISENSDMATRTDADDEKGLKDDLLQMLRNLGETISSGAQAKSTEEEDSSANLRSGIIETETSDRDDAAHIQIKEQRQASREASIEEENESRQEIESKDDSKSASPDYSNVPSDGELKSFDEVLLEKAASPEDNSRSSYDADHDNSKSADMESEDPFRVATDLVEPLFTATRTILKDDLNIDDDETERSDSHDSADTRMAPRDEDSSTSGHQVDSNYFGGSRSVQSQYPYTPLESRTAPPLLPLQFPDLPLPHKFPSLLQPISAQNWEHGPNFKPFRPFTTLPPLDPLPPLPPLSTLEPNERFKLPPLDHRFKPYHQPEPWKDCFNCNSPFQNYQHPFQRFQRLIPPLNFKSLPHMFPMSRQGSSEESRRSPGPLSMNWGSSLQEPYTLRSSVKSWHGAEFSLKR